MPSSDLDKLYRKVKKQGFTRESTQGQHYKWTSPEGAFVFSSSTPSCHFAIRKVKNDLKKIGADL